MELKFLKAEKNEIEVEFDSTTLIEILRVYLNKDSDVTFVAWRRAHATVKPVLKVKTKSKDVKVVLKNAIKVISEDLDSIATNFKKL